MISFFFDIATKKKKEGVLPRKFLGRSNSFHGRRKWSKHHQRRCSSSGSFWGIKIESLVNPFENETPEKSNRPSSITKQVSRNFQRRCVSIALRLTSCLIPYGLDILFEPLLLLSQFSDRYIQFCWCTFKIIIISWLEILCFCLCC